MNLEGGFPRCAVTHLSGGITTSDMLNENNNGELLEYLQTDKVFNYLEDIEDDSMIILSNYEGPNSKKVKPSSQENCRSENMGARKMGVAGESVLRILIRWLGNGNSARPCICNPRF